ncbi:hypothetical protein ACEPAG_8553 [Sanghuangporus baumii]
MCMNHDGSSASSSASTDTREVAFDSRRRSVDVGGLALALGTASLGDDMEMGKGWGGWEESEPSGAMYAELLSDMYTETQNAVKQPVLCPLPSISPGTRQRLIDILDDWHFEPHKLSDEEIIACTQLLFETLLRIEGMQQAVGVTLEQLTSFLLHLRQAYRATNSYHNFQHALDVFQATHMYLRSAGAVPPVAILHIPDSDARSRWKPHDEIKATWIGILRKEDIFALCIAAIGHDVGHPGFNNMFMKNAQAPLSQVYDHKSALEQMHCAFLLPIMKRHGLAHLLAPSPSGTQSQFRRLLLDTVLATDMGVHSIFMQRFAKLMEHPQEFDVVQARTLLCQALIKCADISNPSRPHTVSQHWSAALASEWASQALLERQLCLPVSVQDSDDPAIEANGQISFITLFCSPLLEITSLAVPEMKIFANQCATNCMLWRMRLSELKEQAEPNYPPVPYRAKSPSQPQDLLSVFPLSLPAHVLPHSRANSVIDSDSGTGSEAGSDRTRRISSGTDDGQSLTSVTTNDGGQNRSKGGSNGVQYADSNPSSSRSASPSPFANSSYAFPPISDSKYAAPMISTNGINLATPSSPLPPEISPTAETTSESTSPRSEYAPRTPGGSSGGPASYTHSTAPSISSLYAVPESSIRTAYKLSVRKKKSFHRNSWTPSLVPANATSTSHPPIPNVPSPLSVSGLRTLLAQRNVVSSTNTPTAPMHITSDTRDNNVSTNGT